MKRELNIIADSTERFEFWSGHVDGWRRSGISQAEYCRRNNIKHSSFGHWKRKLSPKQDKRADFVEVSLDEITVPAINGGSSIKLFIGNEFSIELGDGFSPAVLKNLVTVLRDLP